MSQENIKERFLQFIEYKKFSKRAFQQSIGVSNSYIQNISNGIGADVLNRITQVYPELNTKWLLTGEGNMLKDLEQINKPNTSSYIPQEFIQALFEERKRHDEMNAELIRQNGKLIQLLEESKKTVAVQKEDNVTCADASGSGLVG